MLGDFGEQRGSVVAHADSTSSLQGGSDPFTEQKCICVPEQLDLEINPSSEVAEECKVCRRHRFMWVILVPQVKV